MARAEELGHPDLIILPGTKSTMADLLWLQQNGLESAILRCAAADVPVLGVCGGYQMLGERIDDPSGVEGAQKSLPGMGLLPCRTVFAPEKVLTRRRGVVTSGPLSGAALEGYEIHMGTTERRGEAFCRLEDGREDGCCAGNVFGTYLHGLFDSASALEKTAAWLCSRRGLPVTGETEDRSAYREKQYDLLAEGVRAALDLGAVYRIMGVERT